MLEKLASVQLPSNELKQYTSIVNVQTKGVKKFMQAASLGKTLQEAQIHEKEDGDQKRWSSLAGKKRRERLALLNGYVDKLKMI